MLLQDTISRTHFQMVVNIVFCARLTSWHFQACINRNKTMALWLLKSLTAWCCFTIPYFIVGVMYNHQVRNATTAFLKKVLQGKVKLELSADNDEFNSYASSQSDARNAIYSWDYK